MDSKKQAQKEKIANRINQLMGYVPKGNVESGTSRSNQELPNNQINELLGISLPPPWMTYSQELHGTLQDFLDFWRPSTTRQSQVAWISVSNPQQPPSRTKDGSGPDLDLLWSSWDYLCENNQASTSELDRLAHEYNVLGGKWLIFSPRNNVDALWSRIAKATHDGTLGISAKVAPYNESSPSSNHVICVYTSDYTDRTEVDKVRASLRQLGVKRKIGYKPDIYTYCRIYARNKWNISPTRYYS